MRVYRVAISLLAVVCAGQAWAGSNVASSGAGVMGGKGVSICAFPDVCKTPPTPAVPGVPIPYPNIGNSSDTGSDSGKPQYELINIGEPRDSLTGRLRAEDDREDANNEREDANKEYGYWQGSGLWSDDVYTEHKRARNQQPKKEYEPYEGKPRYVELPEPETDSPPTLTPAEIDRAFENLDREEYYRVLNAHADGKATIEEVEAAYARVAKY